MYNVLERAVGELDQSCSGKEEKPGGTRSIRQAAGKDGTRGWGEAGRPAPPEQERPEVFQKCRWSFMSNSGNEADNCKQISEKLQTGL